MPQTIVNLALPVITEKIDRILGTYPLYPHQQSFASADLRQKLTAYVISRMPGFYVAMEHLTACSLESPLDCYTTEQHEQVDQLIHQGISHLLSHQPQRGHEPLGDHAETPFTPSSWFG